MTVVRFHVDGWFAFCNGHKSTFDNNTGDRHGEAMLPSLVCNADVSPSCFLLPKSQKRPFVNRFPWSIFKLLGRHEHATSVPYARSAHTHKQTHFPLSLYQGVTRSVWDPETFASSADVPPPLTFASRADMPPPSRLQGAASDWDGIQPGLPPGGLSPLVSAKACHMAKRRVGYSTLSIALTFSLPEAQREGSLALGATTRLK